MLCYRNGLRLAIAILTLATIIPPATSLAFSSGPPNGMTNAPGESVCTACHSSFPLNSGSGSLTIDGIGSEYTPGQTYQLEVTLADPDAQRWGFEATAYSADLIGPVGLFSSLDANTQATDAMPIGRQYIKQTSTGTFFGQSGSATWLFEWIAPTTGTGNAAIYVAANAANGNFNNQGDLIYTASKSLSEVIANADSSWGDIKTLYR